MQSNRINYAAVAFFVLLRIAGAFLLGPCRRFYRRSLVSFLFHFKSKISTSNKISGRHYGFGISLSHQNDEIYGGHKNLNLYNEVTTCYDFLCAQQIKKNDDIFGLGQSPFHTTPTKLNVVPPHKRFAASIYYYQLNEPEFSMFALIRRTAKMAVVRDRRSATIFRASTEWDCIDFRLFALRCSAYENSFELQPKFTSPE